MTSTNALGLTVERVHNKSESDLGDLLCSAICEGILWKPIACQECETHFCSMCIEKWFEKHPRQCPLRCNTFTERNCSKFIARQLAKLQITCIYCENGCQEVVAYEALEKHEQQCEYQFERCTGCSKNFLRRDRETHRSECPSLDRRHRNQGSSYRDTYTTSDQWDMNAGTDDIRQQQRKQGIDDLTRLLAHSGVIPNDNEDVMRRVSLLSTTDSGKLPTSRVIRNTSSASCSRDGYLCWKCENVAWDPVSCESCRTTFCKACSPWTGVIGKLVGFFSSNAGHGRDNCQRFQVGILSKDFMKSITDVSFRCAYAQNGCTEQLAYDNIGRHEKTCSYEMLPCQVCHMLLSKRPPVTEHTTRACFEHMHQRSPTQIQEQFMILLKATEKADAENRRLENKIKTLEERLQVLDTTCVKKQIDEKRSGGK